MTANLWNIIAPSLTNHSQQTAWVCRGKSSKRTIRYKEINDAVFTLAHKLRKLRINTGDTVGITAPNGPEWCVAAFACWKVGATIAPIHIGNSEADIENQINAVNPKAMLLHNTKDIYANGVQISMLPILEDMALELTQPHQEINNPIAVRIYTSGSTGSPKIVRLSHNNLSSNMISACKIKDFNQSDRFISLLPFSHAMGLTANLLLPFYCGSTIVSPKAIAASEILATLEEERISVVIAVPRLFRNIMNGLEKTFEKSSTGLKVYIWLLRRTPLSLKRIFNTPLRKKLGGNITAWISGGSHLDSKILEYFHRLGLPLRQGYGLTETSPLACVQVEFDSAVTSVGKPIESVNIRIANPDSEGHGEVHIKGPNVMLGYEDEQQNNEAFDNGWFKTGDIGVLDRAGRVTLTGRSKRLIVTEAGKNVYPEEIETLLERDLRIKEAGVFELEMKPVCVISTDQGETNVKQALKQFNQLVSAHNRITRFAIVDELPRTSLGKLALQELPSIFAKNEITA